MASRYNAPHGFVLHPLHAVLVASILPLFLGALLSDIAYGSTYEVQWKNFASWLIAGGLVFVGFSLLWSVIDLLRAGRSGMMHWLYPVLLAATFVVGFINALVHAKDAWSSMPAATILSVVMLVLAMAAIWSGLWAREARS